MKIDLKNGFDLEIKKVDDIKFTDTGSDSPHWTKVVMYISSKCPLTDNQKLKVAEEIKIRIEND